jgi:hypothetical protein
MPRNLSMSELTSRIAEITSGPSDAMVERVVRVLQEHRHSPVEVPGSDGNTPRGLPRTGRRPRRHCAGRLEPIRSYVSGADMWRSRPVARNSAMTMGFAAT